MAEKHLVFLVHGMGKHEAGWSKPLEKALVDASKSFAYFKKPGKKLLDRVAFKEIVYDSYFEKILENWDANAEKAIEAAQGNDREVVEDSLQWLSESSGDKASFFWTHVVDVVLWRINPYMRHAIMTSVAKALANAIHEQVTNNFAETRFSIISHSLGTSVAHDVLDALAKGDWEEAPSPYAFSGKDLRFSAIHTIANVSRILEVPSRRVYSSRTRPGPLGDENSYTRHFYNYRHQLDPFTLALPFQPDWDPNVFHSKTVRHLHDYNVHDVIHYVKSPIVHVPILRSLCRFGAVTRLEEVEAIEEFPRIGRAMKKKAAEELEEALGKAKDAVSDTPDLLDLLKAASLFYNAVEKFNDQG